MPEMLEPTFSADEPRPAAWSKALPPEHAAEESEAQDRPAARPRSYRELMRVAVSLFVLACIAGLVAWQWPAIALFYRWARTPAVVEAPKEPPPANRPKIADRLDPGGQQAPAPPPGVSPGAAPGAAVAQRHRTRDRVDPQNRSVAQNVPLKIYTLYAVKLDSIVEYRDNNPRNNVADYGRVYNSTTGRFTNYFNRVDTLYKKVDLKTNWTASPITSSTGTDYRSWTFNLTAGNLTYTNVANYTAPISGPTPLVRFTFHLNASVEEVNNATVPQWRVTVDTVGGRRVITNASRIENLVNVSGKVVHYDLKWDQEIQGWSYAGPNTAPRRRLFLELGAIVGNLIPAALVDAWFDARGMDRLGETGSASYNTTAGAQRANDTTSPFLPVRPVATARPSIAPRFRRAGTPRRRLGRRRRGDRGHPARPGPGHEASKARNASAAPST